MSKAKVRAKWANESIEPILDQGYKQIDLLVALNWYNTMTDSKTSTKYLNDYLKSIKSNKTLTSNISQQTAAAVCRLLSRKQGDYRLQGWMDRFVDRLEVKVVTPTSSTKKKVLTIQQLTAIKLNEYITELDNAFENFLDSGLKMKYSSTSALAKLNVKSSYTKDIIIWASGVREEFIESKTDKDMKEGYSNFTNSEKNKIIKFFDVMIEQVSAYGISVKPVRKKKKVPASKLVEKLKYLEIFPELGIKSIKPESMVGAKEIWLYNTSTKMLTYYTSEGGMTISGTSIKFFDSSEQRRLRKPEKQLVELTKSRKGQWIKKFKSMAKTVTTSGTGRVNTSTIILKAFV
jgi:hypothetical protein